MELPCVNDTFLKMENKRLNLQVKAFHNGEAYRKLRQEYEAVIRKKDKEIRKLNEELAESHAQNVAIRDLWFEQCEEIWKETDRTISEQREEIKRLHEEIFKEMRKGDERVREITKQYEELLKEKNRIIEELENKLAHAMALLDRDGTTTGLPTAQTPLRKKKVIPNSRRSTGKKKGGQPGHEKHTLKPPAEEDINDTVKHELDEDETCPACSSGNVSYTGNKEERFEYDIEINVIKRKHIYYEYECQDWGKVFYVIFRTESEG